MERVGKGFLRLLSGKGRVHFSAIKCCTKCAKKQCRKEKQKRVNYVNLMPIIYIKGSCYETPLYGHVLGDKRNGDKRQGMKCGSPCGWGWGRGGVKG